MKQKLIKITDNHYIIIDDAGNKRGWSGYPNTDNWTEPNKEQYISNLKFDKQ